ncbi:hypothetical protein TNCV_2307761 [Trichonephila clavipes]|nr:hypothetical protein TNCV_2307761 [Trichonephila clavipes]
MFQKTIACVHFTEAHKRACFVWYKQYALEFNGAPCILQTSAWTISFGTRERAWDTIRSLLHLGKESVVVMIDTPQMNFLLLLSSHFKAAVGDGARKFGLQSNDEGDTRVDTSLSKLPHIKLP